MGAQDSMPRGDDDVVRRLGALEASYSVLLGLVGSAKALAQAIQTGLGLLATSGTTWAGPVSSPSTIASTGDLTVGGLIRNLSAYSNPITSGFRNLFVTNIDGQFGFNLSSREFKQDIEAAIVDPADVLKLRLVTYRYIQAVETFGDEAAREYGFIAEEVEEAGLGWLVDYDEVTGKPLTLKFHLIAMAMLVVAQCQERRLAELERRAGI
jgi:hypothetical protein